MRIFVVVPYYKPAYIYGGPVHSIPSLYEALARLGVEVSVLTTNANGPGRLEVPLGQPLDVDGVTVRYFPLAIGGKFYYSPSLAAASASMMAGTDLVVLEGLWAHAVGPVARACLRAQVPYVMPLRGQLLPWSLRQKNWKKRLYLALRGRPILNKAAALHCTDHNEAEAAASLGLGAPTFIVPNGVDASRFSLLPERGALRQRFGIPMDGGVLLFLGRLHQKKRPDIAVEALAAAQDLPEEVHLVVAGPDEEGIASTLLAQAQRLGCTQRLHIIGLLRGDEVLQALVDADLMLMPSEPESENFGMSALEAMAAGVPVLVSEGVPVGRWAQEAGAGLMTPCTGRDFAQETRELLLHPAQLQKMGEKGRRLVKERYDLPVVALQMLAQFQAIITTGRPLP